MQNHDEPQASVHTNAVSPTPEASPPEETARRDPLDPYVPPNVPHGLPHVVRFATLSSLDLPIEARFLIIILARYADVNGVASVALDTLCKICRIGSHHTVTRYITMAEEIRILRKEPGQGGKDRQSNTYKFLGEERNWQHLPVGHPDDNPVVVLAEARLRIERLENQVARIPDLEAKAARVEELESELARLKNGAAIGHFVVTNGDAATAAGLVDNSYETADSGFSRETDGAIRHSEVTDGTDDIFPQENSHGYENPDSRALHRTHEAIRHSGVTNGLDEGQDYLARRTRVEQMVMKHRDYYQQSFDRRGLLGAIEFFSRSDENEKDLLRQVGILDAGGDPRKTGTDPPPEAEDPPRPTAEPDRYAVGECPDCSRPFGTYGGAEYCSDCTERRRRESEA